MKTRIASIVALLIVGALLFSCGTNTPDQNGETVVDIDQVHTQAVATYASSLTETLVANPITSPTPIILRTDTPIVITATIEASPTSTSNPCYNLMYIGDVTIPDGTVMKAGEVFVKTWKVQNIGGCAWRTGFTFRHYGGDPMRGNTVALTEAIQTGSIRDLSVQLVVPSENGAFQSAWRMADENGNFFGDTLTVEIVVEGGATPVPTGTP